MASNLVRMFVILGCFFRHGSQDLIVNVQSKNGDISQQEFKAFPEEDLVFLSYKLDDGQFIDISLDFKQKLQIFKTIILGERDIAERAYKMTCIAIRMNRDEYVSPDAIAKLRQKNPSTIRSPEEDLGTQEIILDHKLQISEARNINPNVRKICGDIDVVHFSGDDVKFLFDNNSSPNAVQNLTSTMRTKKRCHSVSESNVTCVCRVHVCISWYPCDLKYCQGEQDGKATEFRCGIKTCGKCRDFDYLVNEKYHCFWDNRQK